MWPGQARWPNGVFDDYSIFSGDPKHGAFAYSAKNSSSGHLVDNGKALLSCLPAAPLSPPAAS